MQKEDLLKIIDDDELGLLTTKPQSGAAITADERLVASFQEINDFFQQSGKEPEVSNGIHEHRLATRLKSIREDAQKSKALIEYDRFHLLHVPHKELNSIHDLFEDDDIGLLSSRDESLFQVKHVPVSGDRENPDYIARRKPCKDFAKFESLFQACQADLSSGKRKLIKFESDKQIKEERFFVLNGVLLLVENIGEVETDKYGKIDGRQRCIFENGTESEMLLRSLVKRLYENGHAVSDVIGDEEKTLLENFGVITKDDSQTGFIYILKSLSDNPKIKAIENLYKIGFSTTPVEERIKNAVDDPTYLMAQVAIVSVFECYNLNPQKLEQLLHNFFGDSCLNIDIFDKNNRRYIPREWFIVPLPIIKKSIELIINGAIVNYRYDHEQEKILLR